MNKPPTKAVISAIIKTWFVVSLLVHLSLIGFFYIRSLEKVHKKTKPSMVTNIVIKNQINNKILSIKKPKEKYITKVKENKIFEQNLNLVETSSSMPNNEIKNGEIGIEIKIRFKPMLINGDNITVSYPKRARQLMIEGVVRMLLTISPSGLVVDAKILNGPAFGLRDAALLLAKKLQYLPATDNEGNAISSHIEHEVVFKLKNS
jgi:TonB family protein